MNQAIDQAMRLIEQGATEKGLNKLEDIEKTANHDTKYTLAQVYFELGLIDRSKVIIDELLALYPDEGELYTFAAELYIDLDQEDEAIEMLLEIKEQDEAYLQAQLLLADLYQMQGLDEVAEQKLLQAAKRAPDEPIISFGLAEFYLDRGDYGKSIPYYKKVIYSKESLPTEINVDLRMAEAYSANGQFEDALIHYEKGLKNSEELNAIFGYGYTAYQLGEYKTAIAQFEKLKELDPQYSSLYPYLAKALEAQESLNEALTAVKEGVAVDEYNDSLFVHAGKLSLKLKQTQQAEEYLRDALALNPANFEAFRTLAAFLREEERYDDVIELIAHIKEFGEEDPLFEWYLASAYHHEDQVDKADKHYQRAIDAFREDADFLEEYGRFLLELGYREKALAYLRKSVGYDQSRLHLQELIFEIESYS
ncbi:tetratricopeptide repeat protein [Desertibacillus haloalkaliphilus]|uniref:tetratricopeptide repeat protein n=1 Tax=Desertibacillus haloalkaliphilus TaxID=1328930 RepID=UPI001C26686A|nr:tetratricopeptide repeat protein [Desertibacillus haloalkaliphilus]MBU8907259.1 tetratricopeptide repeat protein [Desertibacillus haloalkaliphilus]